MLNVPAERKMFLIAKRQLVWFSPQKLTVGPMLRQLSSWGCRMVGVSPAWLAFYC